jgi:hypothetical protein
MIVILRAISLPITPIFGGKLNQALRKLSLQMKREQNAICIFYFRELFFMIGSNILGHSIKNKQLIKRKDNQKIIPNDATSIGRKPVWPKAIRPKMYLAE